MDELKRSDPAPKPDDADDIQRYPYDRRSLRHKVRIAATKGTRHGGKFLFFAGQDQGRLEEWIASLGN